jgi:PadR family transcriptional regulator, regulatory protein AphA
VSTRTAEEAPEAPAPSIELSLLGLLGERPMHGYELYLEMRRESGLGLVWKIKQAHLYAVLSRLEGSGLIASELVASARGPERKVFRLTAAGKEAFGRWVRAPSSRQDFRLDFPAKFLFATRRGGRAASSLVAAQRRLCSSWIDDMRSRGAACAEGGLDALVYRYRVGQLEAAAAWLEDCAAFAARGAAPSRRRCAPARAKAARP